MNLYDDEGFTRFIGVLDRIAALLDVIAAHQGQISIGTAQLVSSQQISAQFLTEMLQLLKGQPQGERLSNF